MRLFRWRERRAEEEVELLDNDILEKDEYLCEQVLLLVALVYHRKRWFELKSRLRLSATDRRLYYILLQSKASVGV